MTYPSKPSAAYDYVSYQAGSPTTPLPASNVAADYAGHKAAIDALIDFVKIPLRSDGLLKSGTVTPQALSEDTLAMIGGFTPRGTWTTATAYAVSDVVEYPALSGLNYFCVTAHTAGTFATDLAAGKWQTLTSLRLADDLDFTGDNTHAGTETFNGAVTFTAGATFSGAAAFAGASFSDAVTMDDTLDVAGTATFDGDVVLNGETTATTADAGNSDTLVATTEFVQNEFATRYGRNVIINGDMAIDQRNAGASQTFTAAAAVAYCVDRWYASCTGANVTGQRVAGTSPNPYAYRFTGLAGNTGVLFGQRIEAENCAHLVNQTVHGQVQVKSSSLTSITWTAYYANSTDTFSSKTLIATGTLTGISSTLATKTFSFSAGANAGNGICIEFTGGALLGSQTLQFEAVQLELGQNTAFERIPMSERQMRCFRYCIRRKATGANQITLPGYTYITNTQQNYTDRFPVQMRAAPTFSCSAAGDFYQVANATTVAATGLTAGSTDPWGAFLTCANVSASLNVPALLASQNSSAWLQYEAEL